MYATSGRVRRLPLVLFAVLAALGFVAGCTTPPSGGTTNKAPVAVASANPGSSAMEVVFSSAGSHDPDGTIVGYHWAFSDGSAASQEENPTRVFVNTGNLVATLTITDNKGATSTAQASITLPVVPNQPPVAGAPATPNEGPAPVLVQFSSAGTNDPEGGVITSYRWNFGDGIESTEANPSHTYSTLGDFDVTLTVTDPSGATGTTTIVVSTWVAQIENPSQGRCVDLAWGNTGNNTTVSSYPCKATSNQQWVLGPNGRISSAINENKCLDALNGGALGTNVGIYDCNGTLHQRWIRSGNQLVNDANDLCLAARNGYVEPSTPLVLAACNPAAPEQQWVVARSKAAEYLRVRNPGADRCIGISGNTLSNGRAIADWPCTDDSSMAWYLDPNGFLINRAGPDWCMDGNYGTVGKAVLIWECGDVETWKRWHRDGDLLVNNTNNLCMTRSTANQDLPAAAMTLTACDSANPNQQFVFEPAGQWQWQQLRSPVTGNCAVVANTNNGTKLQTEACDSTDAGQSWYLDAGGRLFHRWAQGARGACADGNNNGVAGNEIIAHQCNLQPWQKWTVVGDTIVNNANNLCVASVGTGLRLATCDGSDAQRWTMVTQ